MAQYRANQPATVGSSSHGNAFNIDAKATVTANLTTADEVVLGELPAGHRLSGFKYRAGDLDTGTTLTANIGYRSKHPDQGVTAAPTYFASASTAFQAAQSSWVDLAFEPITFQEPVEIVLKPAANATGLSGTPSIWSVFTGSIVGVR